MGISRSRIAIVSLLSVCLALPAPAVFADVISTDQVVQDRFQVNRDKVKAFLERSTVRDRLLALGVSAVTVGKRVDALTDAEVTQLAQRIDALPAGGTLSQNEIIIILLIAILVAVAIA